MSLWTELKRRNVFRVLAAYLVSSWLLIEIGTLLFESFEFPQWAGQLLITILALGLIPVVIFSWAYELTPEGVKRDSEIQRDTSITHHTGRRLDQITIAMILMALGVIVVERFVLPAPGTTSTPVATLDAGTKAEASGVEPTASTSPEAARAEPPPNSIAVLPFANMSADPENEYFSDGVSEEILNELARIPELKVAARTSAFQFKDDNRDIGEIGRLLNVNHVLEGSVRRAGDRVRVTAQLISVADGFHMWSDTFDRQMVDIFAIQDEIATAIARAMEVTLIGTDETGDTENVEAYNLFLQGRAQLAKRNTEQAIEKFQQAIEIDPGYGRAYGNIAFARVMGGFSEPDQEVLEASVAPLVRQALEINPADPLALTARAQLLHQVHRFDAAAAAFEEALAVEPDNPDALHLYGILTAIRGDPEAGLALAKRAAELDPLSPIINDWVARHLAVLGMLEEALGVTRDIRELAPDFAQTIGLMADLLLALGRDDEAIDAYEAAIRAESSVQNDLATRAKMLAAMGQADEAKALVDEIVASDESPSVKAFAGLTLVHLGDIESAVEIVNRGQPINPGILYMYLRSLPAWRQPEFADHPALQALADSVGLPLAVER